MQQERPSRLADFRRGLARYTPVVRLAAGGMGEVWRGEASFEDGHVEEVAIKRVLPHLARNELYALMLEDEARLGMLLKHPNIVRVYDARTQGSFILVMEYVHGTSLQDVLKQFAKARAQMPITAALHIARELARALEYAHEALDEFGRELGIIHGDVSPHNVLLGVEGQVKLMDFGLARASANLTQRDQKRVSGKYGYLAPELLMKKPSSQLVDLFALGVVLWECTTNRRLFYGRNSRDTIRLVKRCEVPRASSLNPAVTPELDAVFEHLLTRKPEQRCQSAAELGRMLDRVLLSFDPRVCQADLAAIIRAQMAELDQAREQARVHNPLTPREGVMRLSEAQLEDFFASCQTSVYQRPSEFPKVEPNPEAFSAISDTGLQEPPA